VRRLLPWVERMTYLSRLPRGLLRPPKTVTARPELVRIDSLKQ